MLAKFPTIRPLVIIFTISVMVGDVLAVCPIRRLQHRSRCCATATAPPRTRSAITIDDKIIAILRRAGLEPGTIPQGNISFDNPKIHTIAQKWSRVQTPLEQLFLREFQWDSPPALHLVVRESGSAARIVISHPGDDRIVDILCRTLLVEPEAFDQRVTLYGEMGSFAVQDLKPEIVNNGQPKLVQIQGLLREMLQSDKELSAAARTLRGAFKPIASRSDLTEDAMQVLTEWQELASDANMRIYWRAKVSLNRQPEDRWQLETVLELGERYRSQSFNQIQKFTDTNRIETSNAIDQIKSFGEETETVRYRTVRSASERMLTDDARSQLNEMAAGLWTKARTLILRNADNG